MTTNSNAVLIIIPLAFISSDVVLTWIRNEETQKLINEMISTVIILWFIHIAATLIVVCVTLGVFGGMGTALWGVGVGGGGAGALHYVQAASLVLAARRLDRPGEGPEPELRQFLFLKQSMEGASTVVLWKLSQSAMVWGYTKI